MRLAGRCNAYLPCFTWAGDGIYVHLVGPSNPLMWAYIKHTIKKVPAQVGLPTCAAPPVLP
jgi:hypothetical protein